MGGFRGLLIGAVGLVWLPLGLAAQSVLLPLPVDVVAETRHFEVSGSPGTVLTGFLIPADGPLNAWAPVWSTLQVDGSLKEGATGAWTGPRPPKWLKVTNPGSVVGGFRFLIRTGPGAVQTRQAQVFWLSWANGAPGTSTTTSRVYGLAAAQDDEVRIIELRLPPGAVASGFYGQTLAGNLVQLSLVVKPGTSSTAATPTAASPQKQGARAQAPSVPEVPPVALSSPF